MTTFQTEFGEVSWFSRRLLRREAELTPLADFATPDTGEADAVSHTLLATLTRRTDALAAEVDLIAVGLDSYLTRMLDTDWASASTLAPLERP